MVRLLVLDQSRILLWRIGREAPEELVILPAFKIREAERLIRDDPPDAAVVSLTPAQIDWRAFQRLCATRRPPVPVLYESCVHSAAEEIGLDAADGYAAFLPKPAPLADLRRAIGELLAEACRTRRARLAAEINAPPRS